MHQAIDGESCFSSGGATASSIAAFDFLLQLGSAHLQHFGCAIQNLATQVGRGLRPAAKCRASCGDRIAKILLRGTTVIRQQRAVVRARRKYSPVFAANELAANQQLVGLLNCEARLSSWHS